MSRDNTVRVRLSDIELQALKQYAESIGVPMSEVLRDHVKTLIGGNFRGVEPRKLPAIHPDAPLAGERGDSALSS